MNNPTESSPSGMVLFSHGHESGPEGLKIRRLRPVAENLGWDTEAIDYRDLRDDPAARSARLVEWMDRATGPVVLVGSSMGGWVSMDAAEKRPVAGLFLMAPALFMEHRVPGGETRESYQPRCPRCCVVHGWSDSVIPWQNSLKFAQAGGTDLHLIDADHRLEGAITALETLLGAFLEQAGGQ